MKTIRIASENTDALYQLNAQIEQMRAAYEQSKAALDKQYIPTLRQLEQRRNFLIGEVQREEQEQLAQLQQAREQTATVPAAVTPPLTNPNTTNPLV